MSDDRDIAIVGMAGRFPGARTVEELWANIHAGVESISFFTNEQLLAATAAPEDLGRPNFVPAGACMADVELFDADFFGYTAREAEVMDPQHRVFLEAAWEAMEHSGYDPARVAGSVGVFAGAGMNSYLANVYSNPDVVDAIGRTQILLGNELGFLSTRVSYKLDLRGPSISLRTACSTSLVAVHLACRSLRERECDLALSGGVYLNLEQEQGYLWQEGSFLSPDGHCRPFDAAAAGTLFGSGVGVVALRRLDDALDAGDTVHAVIKGSAVNNDGGVKVGFTAPSVAGQAAVIIDCLRDAGTTADAIGYVEAHGTGTALGDPIEIRALAKAYAGVAPASVPMGSLKSNIGHLDAAAGVAGLMKVVSALNHETLPRTLHFERANPDVEVSGNPFVVQRDNAPWPRSEKPRLAGLSAFGFGGTNAHLVLQEAPIAGAAHRSARSTQLLTLSARSHEALEELTARMAVRLRRGDIELADVAYTTAVGRYRFPVRRTVTGPDCASVAAAMESRDPQHVTTDQTVREALPVAFVLAGQGSQHPGMAGQLYAQEPVFRETVDLCAKELTDSGAGVDVVAFLVDGKADADTLDQTMVAQPVLFVLEYALAQMFAAWGIRPTAMLGHSLGEFVAACLAGVFTVEDALRLVTLRGRLMQKQPTGAMVSVVADRATLLPLLTGDLSLAAHNGPKDCVVSGPHAAVEAFVAQMSARRITTQPVRTSHGFHSVLMSPMVDEFVAAVAAVPRQAPKIRFVSNVTGDWITDKQAQDPHYWGRQALAPVEFVAGVGTLATDSDLALVEIGPGPTLSSLARRILAGKAPRLITAVLPHRRDRRDPVESVQRALGQLWLAGVEPDWTGYFGHERRRRVPLPTYPFQRRRYWLSRNAEPAMDTRARPRADIKDWFELPSWQRTPLPATSAVAGEHWLVFVDELGLGTALTDGLRSAGARVTSVAAGAEWSYQGDHLTIDPGDRGHYVALLRAVQRQGHPVTRVAHCWHVTGGREDPSVSAVIRLGFDSLLLLAQALNSDEERLPRRIWVVTDGLYSVTGTEQIMAVKATALGPCGVIPREHPEIACRSVDLALDGTPTDRHVEQLLREFSVAPAHPAVAYRNGHRWTRTYVAAPLPPAPADTPALRADGVYVITGGTGGLGLALAEHLARPGRRLALIARTKLPPEQEWDGWIERPAAGRVTEIINRLRAVRRRGAEAMIVNADVCDEERMRASVADVVARWGRVDGAFHAAGIAGGGLVQLRTPEDAARVMAPKVYGTLYLERALADQELDFLFCFGSNAANVGDFGLVDYVAANSFLDAFAHSRAPHRRVLTVDWGPWQEVGMAVSADIPERLAQVRRNDVAERGMAPVKALEALDRVLASATEPQLVVSPVETTLLIDSAFTMGAGDPATRLAKLGKPPVVHPRPEVPSRYAAPSGERQRVLCDIWKDMLGIERVGVNDSFFDLGGNSLIAIQLVATVNASMSSTLTVAQLYEALTVARTVALIDGDETQAVDSASPALDDVRSRARARRQHQQQRMARSRDHQQG